MEKKSIKIALAGNPNCGKSTLFNNITGARQHVGNYPGVTVEKKEGDRKFNDVDISVVDLPGTYSLSGKSEDEQVAVDYLLEDKPDLVVNVIDSSNLERNLYLATQLMELKLPMVFAFNMTDVAESKGIEIDYKQLSNLLGSPIVPIIGSKNKGTDDLLEMVLKVVDGQIKSNTVNVDYGDELNLALKELAAIVDEDRKLTEKYPAKYLAIKLLEQQDKFLKFAANSTVADKLLDKAASSAKHVKAHYGDDAHIMVAENRYGFISGACTETVRVDTVAKRHDISDKIDSVVLNRVFALPIFAAVMYGIFKFTFSFSEPVVGWFETGIEKVAELATKLIPEGLIQSMVVDGIIGGIGGVLGFFPLVIFMFFAIAFFEDSGYMARAAFIMDRIMRRFGLPGKSFLPMMISTNGCAVPGIMASRTLESSRDRMITMLVTPFMICGAKLPIFALFIAAFFSADKGANLMFVMYGLSVVIALGAASILNKFVLKGESSHFVLELPPYRVPTIKGMLLKTWERGREYLKKAATILVLCSVIIWAGFTFPNVEADKNLSEEQQAAVQLEGTYAGQLGKVIEPIVKPIGFDWRGGVALIAGVVAKEVVVSTLGTIYSLGEVDVEDAAPLQEQLKNDPSWNPLNAFAFLMFCLCYMPCIVAVAVFYREAGSSLKWTGFLILATTVMAWLSAFIVYQGGTLLGIGA